MRKVPGNVQIHSIDRTSTKAADLRTRSIWQHESLGHHNNAMLRRSWTHSALNMNLAPQNSTNPGNLMILRRAAEKYDDIMNHAEIPA